VSQVIKIDNISKQYRLGSIGTNTLRGDLQRWWYTMRGLPDPTLKIGQENLLREAAAENRSDSEYVWALRNINLDIEEGEVLGVIGKNGAGKSTLLKLLSRVTAPTTGSIKVKGRIASLLEVGTGFHPDLTGRENIYLNGAILGMKRFEISSKLDEIIDFAGIAKYIDTPVKRYSSGMYVRLAFAVAAHLEPEILIVDEVLAVGDAEFQKKAVGKMQDVSSLDGRTVIFVSHNMGTIRRLCKKGILLSNGTIVFSGGANQAIYEYENSMNKLSEATWLNTEAGNMFAYLDKIEIRNEHGQLANQFFSNEEVRVHFYIRCIETIRNVKIGFDLIKNGDVIFRSQQVDSIPISVLEGGKSYELFCKIPGWFLNSGDYQIRPLFSLHCAESLTSVFDIVSNFRITLNSNRSEFHTLLNEENHPGVIFPMLDWSIASDK
jgi:lipopolysaccharide transport system ATP-binding protein